MSLLLYIAMPPDVLSKGGNVEYEYAKPEQDTSSGGWEAYTTRDGHQGFRRPKGSGGKEAKKPEEETTNDKPDVINLAEDKKAVDADPVEQFSKENVEGGEGKEEAGPGALEAQEGDPAESSDEDAAAPTKDTDGANTLVEPSENDQSKTLVDQVHNVQDNEVSTAGTGSKPTEFESDKTQEMPATSAPEASKEPEANDTISETPEVAAASKESETTTSREDAEGSSEDDKLPVVQEYNKNFEEFQSKHKEYESKLKDLDKQEAALDKQESKIGELEKKAQSLESELNKLSTKQIDPSKGDAAKFASRIQDILDKRELAKPPAGKKFKDARQKWAEKKAELKVVLRQSKAKAVLETQALRASHRKEVASLRQKVKASKAEHKKAVSDKAKASASIAKERASVEKQQSKLQEPKKPSDEHKQLQRTKISQHRKTSKESAEKLQEYLDSGKADEADVPNIESAIKKYQSNARNASPSAADLENKRVLDSAMGSYLKEHEGNTAAAEEQQKTDEKNQKAVERAKQLARAQAISKEMRDRREKRTKNRLMFSKLYTTYSRGSGQGATMGSAMADPYGGAGRLVNTVDYGVKGTFSAGHLLLDNRGSNSKKAEAEATAAVDKREAKNPTPAKGEEKPEEGTGENAQKSLTGLYILL